MVVIYCKFGYKLLINLHLCTPLSVFGVKLCEHVPLARLDNSKQDVQCQDAIMVQETKSSLKPSAAYTMIV
jgi:hypothetical protein